MELSGSVPMSYLKWLYFSAQLRSSEQAEVLEYEDSHLLLVSFQAKHSLENSFLFLRDLEN